MSSSIAVAQQPGPMSQAAPKSEADKLRGELFILRKLADKHYKGAPVTPNACTGNDCCCQAGTYGTCVDKATCPSIGQCVKMAPGC
jgi:hypothetical protein